MKLSKERKIELLKAVQSGMLKPTEVVNQCIEFVKLPDGKYKRKSNMKVYTREEIDRLKDMLPVKMEHEYTEGELHLCFFTFQELMEAASQI